MSQDTWDKRWMEMAQLVSSWSKDRSRKVGAVIVDNRNTVLAIGWNGFPRGIDDESFEERHQRPAKYAWTEHAERNAIYNAASTGTNLSGSTIYVPWFPCVDCARAIIQSGVDSVVCVEPNWEDPAFDFGTSMAMLTEAWLKLRFVDGEAPVQVAV